MSLHINVWSDFFFTEVFEVSAFLTFYVKRIL